MKSKCKKVVFLYLELKFFYKNIGHIVILEIHFLMLEKELLIQGNYFLI